MKRCDLDFALFISDKADEADFDEREIHNTKVAVNGFPVVIVLGEPDEDTKRLLGE